MKISPNTLEILKNFSEINQSILIQPGNTLSTISTQESLAAYATVEEDFPQQFGLYNLKQFLNLYELYTQPDIQFLEKFLIIREEMGASKARIYSAFPDVIKYPKSDTKGKFHNAVKSDPNKVSLALSYEEIQKLTRAAGFIGAAYLSVESDGKSTNMVLSNPKDETATQYSVRVQDGNGDQYKMYVKTENLRLLKGSYNVDFSSDAGICSFVGTTNEVIYYIAQEDFSTFAAAQHSAQG